MTAGRGIMHQEMPKGDANGRMHGFQLWANLPSSLKMTAPRYQDVASKEIPVVTDDDGTYRFTTIKPGPYPWRNHHNAWRPAHIHFSLFGTEFTQRVVTQMYFPGDPLFALDPIYQAIVDPKARQRLVATYDHDVTQHEWATGYRWDIVLTGTHRTPVEQEDQ